MIRNANTDAPHLEGRYDCCVVGAGPAGMTVALQLAEAGKRVLLLEGGDREYTPESQELYEGELLGRDYDPLDAPRLRYLGGTTGHWGGRCLLLDPVDFEARDHVPLSGWPIGYNDLAGYQAGAARLLRTGEFRNRRSPASFSDTLEHVEQRWSTDRPFHEITNEEPVRFGTTFFKTLEGSDAIDTVLNANLTSLAVDSATGRVTEILFENFNGDRFSAGADQVVLAMGGIENARFLLHLNAAHGNRFGNQGGMVGRCFMEHQVVHHGAYFITRRLYSHSTYWEFERLVTRHVPELILSPKREVLETNRILNSAVRLKRLFQRPLREDEIGNSDFLRAMRFNEDYFFVGESWTVGEQSPNPDSRIVLLNERDRFGIPRVGLDWRLNPLDIESMRVSTLEAAKMLIRSGLGRMRIDPNLWERSPDLALDVSRHHMGGARMSETPETGVVDADCRVHGAPNLYVAGSGVFPTSGHANPTFTIVQLALRLADHLAAA
jgi:choline dehydrogenase-like flavoprotein